MRARRRWAATTCRDVDYVLTTRELAQLLRMFGMDLTAMEPEAADTPFGERSSAGKIFGATGGVMEAAVRTAHFLLTGKELADLKIEPLRGLTGCKEAHAQGRRPRGRRRRWSAGWATRASCSTRSRAGRKDLHFIEVMTCPGGCIDGGGQPLGADTGGGQGAHAGALPASTATRRCASATRTSRSQRLYDEFLGKPLGEKSHHLLHTHYHQRDVPL